MKYIVMALNDAEEIFVFTRSVDHDRMVEACEAIRFGSERNWNRKYRDGEVVAAGFVDGGICHGRSETLDLSSREEEDTKLLAQFNRPAAAPAAIATSANARDTELLDFVIEQETTWYPGYYGGAWQKDMSRGTLCYSKERKEVEGATMREAIGAAIAAQSKQEGGAA